MIDGDTLKAIATIIAVAYPAFVKAAEKYQRRKHYEKVNKPEAIYDAALKRLKEIDELVEIPDHIEMPEALRDLIEERNHYLLESRHYRRLYIEAEHSQENAIDPKAVERTSTGWVKHFQEAPETPTQQIGRPTDGENISTTQSRSRSSGRLLSCQNERHER